ncbi:MAG: glycoside hydrolase family 95 protein, partial [Chitinophagaceae bacterium]
MIKNLFATIFVILIGLHSLAQTDLKLSYDKPAEVWTEALPVGNGRLGGMVFGRVQEELIQLNEATLWSGGPVKNNINPTAFENLAKARASLFQENFAQAANDVKKMQGLYSESFLPMADLVIRQNFPGGGRTPVAPPGNIQQSDTGFTVTNYYRDLDLSRAIATTTFTINGVKFKREVFISNPAQAIVVRISADKPGQINLSLSLHSQLQHINMVEGKNQLLLKGKAPSHCDPNYI